MGLNPSQRACAVCHCSPSVSTFCFVCSSHCLRAAAFYIRGLFSFFQGRYNEAKWVRSAVPGRWGGGKARSGFKLSMRTWRLCFPTSWVPCGFSQPPVSLEAKTVLHPFCSEKHLHSVLQWPIWKKGFSKGDVFKTLLLNERWGWERSVLGFKVTCSMQLFLGAPICWWGSLGS